MRVCAIFNPVAGQRRAEEFVEVLRHLELTGFNVTVLRTQGRGDAERFARDAKSSFDVILAAGGDGTVNEIINGFTPEHAPLAIYPLGTVNILAQELGVPRDPKRFPSFLAGAAVRKMWLGDLGSRRFSLMASVGYDARVVSRVDERLKRMVGRAAYGVAAISGLVRYRPPMLDVSIDGRNFSAGGVIITRSRFYAGHYVIAPQARVTDPATYVCLFGGRGRIDLVRYLAALATNRLSQLPDVDIRPAGEVVVTSEFQEPIQCDGDYIGDLPLRARTSGTPINVLTAAA